MARNEDEPELVDHPFDPRFGSRGGSESAIPASGSGNQGSRFHGSDCKRPGQARFRRRRAEVPPPADVPVPEFERDLEDRVKRPIPFERAVLFSLAAHIVFLLFLIFAPASTLRGRGLLAAFFPPEDKNRTRSRSFFGKLPGRLARTRDEPSPPTRPGAREAAIHRVPARTRPSFPQRNGAEGLAPGASRPSPPAVAQQAGPAQPGRATAPRPRPRARSCRQRPTRSRFRRPERRRRDRTRASRDSTGRSAMRRRRSARRARGAPGVPTRTAASSTRVRSPSIRPGTTGALTRKR